MKAQTEDTYFVDKDGKRHKVILIANLRSIYTSDFAEKQCQLKQVEKLPGTDRWTDKLLDRQTADGDFNKKIYQQLNRWMDETDRPYQTKGQTDRLTDAQKDCWTDKQMDSWTDRQKGKGTNRQKDRWTKGMDRQEEGQMHI